MGISVSCGKNDLIDWGISLYNVDHRFPQVITKMYTSKYFRIHTRWYTANCITEMFLFDDRTSSSWGRWVEKFTISLICWVYENDTIDLKSSHSSFPHVCLSGIDGDTTGRSLWREICLKYRQLRPMLQLNWLREDKYISKFLFHNTTVHWCNQIYIQNMAYQGLYLLGFFVTKTIAQYNIDKYWIDVGYYNQLHVEYPTV